MINQDLRDLIAELNPDTILFDNPSFDGSIIGITDDGKAAYDFEKMIEEMASDDNISLEDAEDFICYNTIRAIPYIGCNAPIIIYKLNY